MFSATHRAIGSSFVVMDAMSSATLRADAHASRLDATHPNSKQRLCRFHPFLRTVMPIAPKRAMDLAVEAHRPKEHAALQAKLPRSRPPKKHTDSQEGIHKL